MTTEEKIQKLLDNYYAPYNISEIKELKWEIFQNEKITDMEKAYEKYKKYLDSLKPKFKELTKLRNKLAWEAGFENFYLYMAKWDGIPEKILGSLDDIQKTTNKKLSKNIPLNTRKAEWFYTIFNNLNFEGVIDRKFNLPDEVVMTINKIDNNFDAKHIGFKPTKEQYFYIEPKGDKTIIYFDKKDNRLSTAKGLAHEIGHAMFLHNLREENKKIDDFTTYEIEKPAIELELKFLKSLGNNIYEISILDTLYINASNQFERNIFSNENGDYDIEYANSLHQVIPEISYKENPFYVIDSHVVEKPCFSTVYSALYCHLI